MVACKLCGEFFKIITESHVRSRHGISLIDYRFTFPEAELVGEDHRQVLLERPVQDYGGSYSLDRGRAISEGIRSAFPGGRKLSPDHIRALRQGHKEFMEDPLKKSLWTKELLSRVPYERTTEYRQLRSKITTEVFKDPLVIQSHSEGLSRALKGKKKSIEHRKALAEARVLWLQEHGDELARKPNGTEIELRVYLNRNFPDQWKYVGDFSLWIGVKNPDFVSIGDWKAIIEVFSWWHNPEDFPNRLSEESLITYYKNYGYDCLVLWDDEVREEYVVDTVTNFTKLSKGKV